MSEKIKNSMNNLKAAYHEFEEFIHEPIKNNRDRAGIIKAFEFTFELVWKTCQKIAQEEGLQTGGPKSSLKQAFKLGLIPNEEEILWLGMLDDRNLMSHTYRDSLSKEICERIISSYSELLKRFIERLSISISQ